MFVLKGKSRLITDKNIFALCFKEYLKKEEEVSLVMIIGSSHGPDFASLSQKREDRVFAVVCVDMFCSECKGKS